MRLGIEANKLYDNMGVMLSRNENPGHFDTPFSIGIWSCSEAVQRQNSVHCTVLQRLKFIFIIISYNVVKTVVTAKLPRIMLTKNTNDYSSLLPKNWLIRYLTLRKTILVTRMKKWPAVARNKLGSSSRLIKTTSLLTFWLRVQPPLLD